MRIEDGIQEGVDRNGGAGRATYLDVVDDEFLESVWAYVSGLGV